MPIEEGFDEGKAIKSFQKDVKSIGKYFEAFSKLKTGDAEVLDRLGKALKAIPPAELLGPAVEELRNNGLGLLDKAYQIRAADFKRCETAFIRQARDAGKATREFTQGWRVGSLELQVKREESRASFLYNGEILVKWQPVSTADDLIEMEKKALSMLEKLTLNQELLVRVMWEAYCEASRRNQKNLNHSLVAISDLYREVRIALIRHSLDGKAPQKKLGEYTDFPKWAFLYNLDLLRALGSSVPTERRLTLETGSMKEVSKGKGFVVNGLQARNEYKVMVYASATSGVSHL